MKRRAFTLIELLVAVAIIAILMGIILPATQAVREAAKRAAAANEINQLSAAVANAKSNMNARYVPSHAYIVPQYDLTPGGPNYLRNQEALSNLRQFFGNRFGWQSPTNPNIILSGLPNWGEIYGSECLVFFLGGYRDNVFANGFSDNSVSPFTTTSSTMVPRTWFDFKINRLWLSPRGVPVYADVWSSDQRMMPYYYFSSRRGNDYTDATRQWNRNGVCWNSAGTYTRYDTIGTANLVTVNWPVVVASMPLIDRLGRYVNPNGQQIVSGGKNCLIGRGGSWTPGQGDYAINQSGYDDLADFKASLGQD